MNQKTFKKFYENAIRTLVRGMCENNGTLNFVDNCGGLFEEYLNQKTMLKVLVKNERNSREVVVLDRHKEAACITVAVMKTRILHPKSINEIFDDYTLMDASRMNDQLAFLCGLNVIISYMAENPEIKKSLDDFIFPPTHHRNGSEYVDSTIRALFYSNIASGPPVLLLSNIFFLLEEYHKLAYLAKDKTLDNPLAKAFLEL